MHNEKWSKLAKHDDAGTFHPHRDQSHAVLGQR